MSAVAGVAIVEQIQLDFVREDTKKERSITAVFERLQALQKNIADVKAGLAAMGLEDKREIEALEAELEGEHTAFVELTARVTEQAEKIIKLEERKTALLLEIRRVEARHVGHRHHFAGNGCNVAGPNQ